MTLAHNDPFRSILTLGAAKDKAKLADQAAKAMARHCDARIRKMRAVIDKYSAALLRHDPELADRLRALAEKADIGNPP